MQSSSLVVFAAILLGCTSSQVTRADRSGSAGNAGTSGAAGSSSGSGGDERGEGGTPKGTAGRTNVAGGSGAAEESGGSAGNTGDGGRSTSRGGAANGGREPVTTGGRTTAAGGRTSTGGTTQSGGSGAMGFGGSGGHAEELGGSAGTGDGGHQEAADGGTTSRGGAGGSGVGGTTATGGSGVGGTTATGGSGVGGATETGGSGVGGTTATGGSGVGGTTATGGSGVGGATATGGSGVGGTTATGGSGVGGATVVDPCDGAPCQNGGTCIPAGTTYTCECTNGYAGATCTRLIFRMVGSVKNSSGDCAAKAVSGNGKVVVGSCKSSTTTGAPSEAYRWANGTTTLLPATTGSAEATGVDDNGIVIVGWTNTATVTRLATWTGTTITTSPYGMGTGTSGTWGEAISGDGRYLLGEILKPLDPTDDYLTQMYITRWDTVAYPIEPITIYTPTVYMSARATDISTDGSVAIGRDDETYHGFLWVEGSAGTALPLIEGALYSDANGISGNGHVVVGSVGTLAVRWIDGGTPVSLGFAGTGMATNENGSIIVGEAGGAPFIWTESEGIEFLATEFEDRGVNLSGWSLQQATDISNDGTIVIGEGTYNGVKRAWIADLSETGIAGQ